MSYDPVRFLFELVTGSLAVPDLDEAKEVIGYYTHRSPPSPVSETYLETALFWNRTLLNDYFQEKACKKGR